ncbi:MAG: DUF885 domain-containing protein [Acidobacteria bacterium]|nr:DUF885 domain-containing protein [Acidobacteriota bacterium]
MKMLFTILTISTLLTPGLLFAAGKSEDEKFELLANGYIESFLKQNPETATTLGDHQFDDKLTDRSRSGYKQRLKLNVETLKSLSAINPARLSAVNRIDYKILQSNVEAEIFEIETLREHEWNPMLYNPGDALFSLVSRDFSPLKIRLGNLKKRLEAVPDLVASAQSNLRNPPKIYTETAILQNKGTISLISEDLDLFLSPAPEMKDELRSAREKAAKALEEYGVWLEKDLLPKSTGDFRIGDKNFRAKLRFTLESNFTKEELLKRCESELKQTQETMFATALPLFKKAFPEVTDAKKLEDRKYVIKSVLDKLAEDRPNNETIVPLATKQLKECTEFVRTQQLMTVPDEPVKIIEMPEFQRGVAVAYCDSPGALEKNGETFFTISPTPTDWPAARVTSYFKEYNNYMTQNLTIHEAMPGHYLQLMHANKFKAPTMVRAIFSSGTFVEGWATYAEQLMAEKGFGGPSVKMQQLKMRLRLIINAMIDQKIHTAGMTEKEAMDLMMNEGFQEEGEAAGKWRRACLSSCQLSTYFVGNLEVNDIRRAYEVKLGTNANLKAMHDEMLSFGSPAPKYVKELMKL